MNQEQEYVARLEKALKAVRECLKQVSAMHTQSLEDDDSGPEKPYLEGFDAGYEQAWLETVAILLSTAHDRAPMQ